MASDNKIALDVEVKGVEKSINSIKDLKTAIKEASNEQVKASEKFGISSKEYIEASKKVSALKDKVDDLKDSTKSLQGSGIERSAQGFNQLGEGLRNLDFDKVKVGLTAMKSALAATGIGLIVALVSTLAEKFDLFGKITDIVTGIVYAFTDAIGLTNKAVESQTKALIEGMDKQQQAVAARYDNEIKLAKASGQDTQQIELNKLKAVEDGLNKQVELLQAKQLTKFGLNEDELKNFEELQIKLLNASADKNAAELDALRQQQEKIQSFFSNSANIQSQLEASKLKGRELALFNSNNNLKKMQDDLEANYKKNSAGSEAVTKQFYKDKEKLLELNRIEEAKINDEFNKQDAEKNKAALAKKFADQQALNQQYLQDSVNQNKAFADILKAEQDIEDAKNNELKVQAIANDVATTRLNLQTNSDIAREFIAKDFEAFKENKERQHQLEVNTIGAIQQVSDVFFLFKKNRAEKGSKQEEELARKQFNVNKGLQLALAIADGYKAITTSLASSPVAIGAVPNPAGIASLAFASISTATAIAKIIATKFQPSGGGSAPSGDAGTPSIPSPPSISTANNNTNKSTLFDENGNVSGNGTFKQGNTNTEQQPVKAYVVETEMTDKQNNIKRIKEQNTF